MSHHALVPFVSNYLSNLAQASAPRPADPVDAWTHQQLAAGGLDQDQFGQQTLGQWPRLPRDEDGPGGGDDGEIDEQAEEREEDFAAAAPGERG